MDGGIQRNIARVQYFACINLMIAIELYSLYDYTDAKDDNLIVRWLADDRISRRDRAKLDFKLDALIRMDFDLAIHTKMLAQVYKNVLKLKVHGEVQLRPMLCRGPIDVATEYTLLAGAVEIGGRLKPESVKENAVARCGHIVAHKGTKHRCKHERFT